MNKNRRKRIQELTDKLQDLLSDLEEIKDEEQGAYDNLPESLQYGEKGEKMSNSMDNLDSAFSSLEEAIEYFNEAIE